eukprot:Unigene13307_Nuclearia_a/m.40325 Unigene13307_Nuclearia_a/g.40325  ORF Unigene13307_Nuclearia_a/g.40325 Unigene13307_Nuclearia_a/m.40325 type:complete len:176 (-) Unigene13307_Nuclearia_a:928-1455(-)
MARSGVAPDELQPVLAPLATELFHDLATGRCWELLDAVAPARLAAMRERGVVVGVISNFDERLDRILSDLGVRSVLRFVLMSGTLGVAKPAPAIFERAVELAGLGPHPAGAPCDCVHVGDSWKNDVVGPIRAGARWRAVFVGQPSGDTGGLTGAELRGRVTTVPSLSALLSENLL